MTRIVSRYQIAVALFAVAMSFPIASDEPDDPRCTGEHPSWKKYKADKDKADAALSAGHLVTFCLPPFLGPEPIRGFSPGPELPDVARGACIEGLVVVQAIIGEDGLVREPEVLRETPQDLGFGALAVAAVKTWKFHPARFRKDGCPVSVYHTVVVEFPPDCVEDSK